jgi:TolA-binding protein
MNGVKMKNTALLALFALSLPLLAMAQSLTNPGVSPGPGVRYATDAYPGFDCEEDDINPQRKEPKWFSFLNGPDRDNPADQFAYCENLVAEAHESKAAKQFDALVREWPTSPEASRAQLRLAELKLKAFDSEQAFKEYRYLLDFYALECDYDAVAQKLYKIANLMRDEGKRIVFFRFKNTVDVRRAFEAAVLRAPGASWAAQALLTIASLREEEGKWNEAIKVYENLGNIYPDTQEAKKAILLEARARMKVLRDCEYNRARSVDTHDFLKQALLSCQEESVVEIKELLDEVSALLEREAFLAAEFYDSKMRTARSAINAYEKFLSEYPNGKYAPLVASRLEELKGSTK